MGASLACGILGVEQAAAKRIHGWLSAFVCFSNASAGTFEALSWICIRSWSGTTTFAKQIRCGVRLEVCAPADAIDKPTQFVPTRKVADCN